MNRRARISSEESTIIEGSTINILKSLTLLAAPLLLLAWTGCGAWSETPQTIETVRAEASEPVSFEGGLDWPQWRGPQRDGVSLETSLIKSWPGRGPTEVWRRPIGDGYSGVAVANGRLFTLYQSDSEYVVALDAATGREVWEHRIDSAYQDGQGDGPRGTPTYDDGMVYAVGAKGRFVALDATTGKPVWTHDFITDFGAKAPTWGFSTSPLIEGDLVFVEPGGPGGKGLAGFHKKTGELAWSSTSDATAYSSPLAVTIDGVRQVLFFTSRRLVSFSPPRKQPNWDFPWQTSYGVNAATPIFVPPDKVFISTGYGVGSALVRVDPSGGANQVEQIWKSRVMKNHFNSSVYHQGFLYGFDDATLKCINAENGEMQWQERGFGKGSLLVADGKLVVLSERGLLALAAANPNAFQETARAQILNGRCWTPPTLAHGKLYLRNQSEIACIALDR